MRRTRKRPPPRYLVKYIEPGSRKVKTLSVGPRQYEMIEVLRRQPASRLDMLRLGRPRVALNATATVRRLRSRGFHIHSEWMTADDGDHYPIRYVEYQLKGRVTSAQPQSRRT